MSSADPTATDSRRGGILGSRAEVMNLFKELLYMLSFLLIIGYWRLIIDYERHDFYYYGLIVGVTVVELYSMI